MQVSAGAVRPCFVGCGCPEPRGKGHPCTLWSSRGVGKAIQEEDLDTANLWTSLDPSRLLKGECLILEVYFKLALQYCSVESKYFMWALFATGFPHHFKEGRPPNGIKSFGDVSLENQTWTAPPRSLVDNHLYCHDCIQHLVTGKAAALPSREGQSMIDQPVEQKSGPHFA